MNDCQTRPRTRPAHFIVMSALNAAAIAVRDTPESAAKAAADYLLDRVCLDGTDPHPSSAAVYIRPSEGRVPVAAPSEVVGFDAVSVAAAATADASVWHTTKRSIQIGDVVELKCGGPRMVVDSLVDGGRAVCTWFRDIRELGHAVAVSAVQHEVFHADALRVVCEAA